MCDFKIIKKTTNGLLLFCQKANGFQLSFNNLFLNLSRYELNSFIDYLEKMDVDYWEQEYKNSIYSKKMPIPTVQSNLIILIDRHELLELKILLTNVHENTLLTSKLINYALYLN